MRIKLAYGQNGLEVNFPQAGIDVIEPVFVKGVADEVAAIRQALRKPIASRPLREIASSHDSVAIIFSLLVVFNILNNSNFSLPGYALFQGNGDRIGSSGHITVLTTQPRLIQFALKILF